MIETIRLFDEDSHQTLFEGCVLSCEQDGDLYYLVKHASKKIKPPENKRFIEFYYCPIVCITQPLVTKINKWLNK